MLQNILNRTKAEGNDESLFSAASTPQIRRQASWLASRIESARHAPVDDLDTETKVIDPALAELMLERNTDNRPLSKRHVSYLADLIKAGQWRLTAQGISFARDGSLTDGQHRLAAIVQAGMPARLRVTFGEERDVFDVLDSGKPRNGADTLHIAGYKYWTNLAAGARLFQAITSGNPLTKERLNNHLILEIVTANPRMELAAARAVKVAIPLKVPSAPFVAALYLIDQHAANPEKVEEFVDRLADGADLKKRDPILTFRNMLVTRFFDDKTFRGGMGAINRNLLICAGIILAWNRWVAGRSGGDKAFRWTPEKAFPQPE